MVGRILSATVLHSLRGEFTKYQESAMKGVVFNLLEEAVTAAHDEAYWDAILREANLVGSYTSLGNYPDSELVRLVEVYGRGRGLQPAEVLRWFGPHMIRAFARRLPGLFAAHNNLRSFLLSLNTLIHPEVRKLYPDAHVPEFEFEEPAHDQLVIRYCSPRRLCALAEGLMVGAAAHYHTPIDLTHPECMHQGHAKCRLEVRIHEGARR